MYQCKIINNQSNTKYEIFMKYCMKCNQDQYVRMLMFKEIVRNIMNHSYQNIFHRSPLNTEGIIITVVIKR